MPTEKVRRLTTIPDEFLARIPKAESELYDAIIEIIAQMEVRGGSFVINAANLEYAAQVGELLKEALLTTDYIDAVTEFAREFDTQVGINDELFSKTFPGFTTSEIGLQSVQIAKREAVDLLLNSAYDTGVIQPLRETLEQAVINGSGFRESLKSIREFIEGDPEKEGALLRYSKTYAHDQFAISDRAYTSIVSEEVDADWFFYSGDEIDTTRPFCAARDNQYFHYKEVESWGDLSPWAGQIPGTNPSTIYSYAGGYNCRHSILPVSVFSVPKDVIQRNIESGNYNPSEKERELVGV
jgi:hypothetical protein